MQTKRCTKCKTVKPVSEFYKDKGKKDGYRYHCKQCFNRWKYAYTDKKKALSNDLTDEWIRDNITDKPCTYCGRIDNTGCDRIDNTRGHTKDNCIPCCPTCNYTRGDRFSHDEMLLLGKNICIILLQREKGLP